jgi:hypothetical protein
MSMASTRQLFVSTFLHFIDTYWRYVDSINIYRTRVKKWLILLIRLIITDFNWAEGKYPDLFAPSGTLTTDSSDYTYRYYSATNAYAGVFTADNDVYYKAADGILKNVGPLSDWLTKAGCK